jgi:hypothetical protein
VNCGSWCHPSIRAGPPRANDHSPVFLIGWSEVLSSLVSAVDPGVHPPPFRSARRPAGTGSHPRLPTSTPARSGPCRAGLPTKPQPIRRPGPWSPVRAFQSAGRGPWSHTGLCTDHPNQKLAQPGLSAELVASSVLPWLEGDPPDQELRVSPARPVLRESPARVRLRRAHARADDHAVPDPIGCPGSPRHRLDPAELRRRVRSSGRDAGVARRPSRVCPLPPRPYRGPA